jgi:hypothetical protein
MEIKLNELDTVFISYDEPNAEENFSKLSEQIHWVKRSHGVKGFDLAHQTAGNLSETNFTITVDGDTQVIDSFFNKTIDFPEAINAVSFNSVNQINGLVYGNGGVKIWRTEFLKNMNFHELSENDGIDFCWEKSYLQLDETVGWTFPNGSALQAWRIGFREGTKLSLNQGKPIAFDEIKKQTRNYQMLMAWLSLGQDVKYGNYAMLGAHQGLLMSLTNPTKISLVKDYDYLKNIFNQINDVEKELVDNNEKLKELIKENIPLYDKETSKWIKNYAGIYIR